jgi:predicted transcriptional regulator
MPEEALLLSIKPEFAKKVVAGEKTIELRRRMPKARAGQLVVLYESSPTQALIGHFRIKDIIVEKPSKLWHHVRGAAGISKKEFQSYFEGVEYGVGIVMEEFESFHSPVGLDILRVNLKGFHPPQGHVYLNKKKVQLIEDMAALRGA